MDKFEKLIKKTVDSYEAPYSEAAWTAMSDKLGPEKGGLVNWVIGGTIAAAAVILGVWYLIPAEDSTREFVAEQKIEATNTINSITEIKEEAPVEQLSNTEVEVVNTISETKKEHNPTADNDNTVVSNFPDTDHYNSDNFPSIQPAKNINNDNTLQKISPKDESQLENLVMAEKNEDFSKFNLQAIADKLNVCAGDEVNFSPSIPKLKADYQWIIDGDKVATGPYTNQIFEAPGNHIVSLQLLNSKTKEVVNQSNNITINVAAIPQNEIFYEFDNSLTPRVNFSQKNVFYKSLNWEIKGLYQTREESFSYEFKNKGSYIVSCQLTSQNGCESVSNTVVNIESNYNLLAPSAFTPNGDNLNETFIPKALLISNSPFIMTIYDKSGQLIFETNDASRPWDGLCTRDLTPAPGGSYVWIVQLTTENNKTETYQGQVTITR